MQLTAPRYLAELDAAKHQHPMDWNSPEKDLFEKVIGRITVRVMIVKPGRYDWLVLHERGGRLQAGTDETLTLAKLQALGWCEQWVRAGHLQGLLS